MVKLDHTALRDVMRYSINLWVRIVIATAGKQSPRFGDFAIASFHFVPFAMTYLNYAEDHSFWLKIKLTFSN